MDPGELMVALFLFFFSIPLLTKIAEWTTSRATEQVVKEQVVVDGKQKVHVHRLKPGEMKHTSPRLKRWRFPLTAGELLVWIGIVICMGGLGRSRISHYWSRQPGFAAPVIAGAMTFERFTQINSQLSFAPLGTLSGYAKIEFVDTALKKACGAAVGITQHVAIDESMIRSSSRYCSWKQYMPRKPIKLGMKVFSLVLSTGFLFTWHIYRGRSDPLNGTGYMYRLIYNVLLGGAIWDHCGVILFSDAAFTSVRLWRALFKRGIRAVGPVLFVVHHFIFN
jgi:hypothetical protein